MKKPVLRNLVYSLVLFRKIKTTQARAKAIRGLVDKLVNKIKKNTVSGKRDVLAILPQKEIVDKLTREIVPQLASRPSGYTRMVKIGERAGDGALMVMMEWVFDEKPNLTNEINSTNKEGAKVEKVAKVKEGKDDKTNKSK